MELSTVDKCEHHFGELIVSHGVSRAAAILQKAMFIFLGGFFLLAGVYSFLVLGNIISGVLLVILGLAGSIPMLTVPGGRREVRVYEEGFVSIQGEKEESVHFSEVSSIGHQQSGVYGRQPIPKIRLNEGKNMAIYVPIQGDKFDWFLKLGHAYATWLFKDFSPKKLQTMDLDFGSRLRLKNSVFIFNEESPRATKWRVSEIQEVTISPKTLDFQLGKKGAISIRVDKVENFHIIPHIVERLNSH